MFTVDLSTTLIGQDRLDAVEDEIEDMSTSGVSTVNSVKMKSIAKDDKFINDEFSRLKFENIRSMQSLLESQMQYQSLMKTIIDEQLLNVDLLKNFNMQLSSVSSIYKRSVSLGYVTVDHLRFRVRTLTDISLQLFQRYERHEPKSQRKCVRLADTVGRQRPNRGGRRQQQQKRRVGAVACVLCVHQFGQTRARAVFTGERAAPLL